MRQLIAGNWKMNGLAASLGEFEALARSLKAPIAWICCCSRASPTVRPRRSAMMSSADRKVMLSSTRCAIALAWSGGSATPALRRASRYSCWKSSTGTVVEPRVNTSVSGEPRKMSAMPQAAKLSASAPRKIEETQDFAYFRIS